LAGDAISLAVGIQFSQAFEPWENFDMYAEAYLTLTYWVAQRASAYC
jgi:hypothetical protein